VREYFIVLITQFFNPFSWHGHCFPGLNSFRVECVWVCVCEREKKVSDSAQTFLYQSKWTNFSTDFSLHQNHLGLVKVHPTLGFWFSRSVVGPKNLYFTGYTDAAGPRIILWESLLLSRAYASGVELLGSQAYEWPASQDSVQLHFGIRQCNPL